MNQNEKRPSCRLIRERAEHSQTVGTEGPVLMQDGVLQETLNTFVHEKIPERAVHVKGYGAFGYFTPFQSMEEFTEACFLQKPGKKVPVAVRFSLAVSQKGTPDTSRNVRGFSVKFYTDDGVFDLLCNHIPVFLVRDAIDFPDAIASLSPSPKNNLKSPERFWRYVMKKPEAMHFITWLYSDVGTADSLRHIAGHSVNTYIWKNKEGRRRYVKYHWIPLAGEQYITAEEAEALAGSDPDVAGEELWHTLDQGRKVEYDLCVQLMNPEDAKKLPYDPLDDTKVWSEQEYPLLQVGRLTLDRNPDDYKAQVEALAFAPANLTEGVELTNDRMLQGRAFVYWDAQRRRLGPDFRSIPINHMKNWTPRRSLVSSSNGEEVCGTVGRTDPPKNDFFTQAGEHYRSMSLEERMHLEKNIARELAQVPHDVQRVILDYLDKADPRLADGVYFRMRFY